MLSQQNKFWADQPKNEEKNEERCEKYYCDRNCARQTEKKESREAEDNFSTKESEIELKGNQYKKQLRRRIKEEESQDKEDNGKENCPVWVNQNPCLICQSFLTVNEKFNE